MSENVLLASQGIYDRKRELYGTELLFRNDSGSTAWDVGEGRATSEVLVNHCSSITDEVEHFNRPTFINVSADFLLSEAFLPVDPKYIFVELVERIQVTGAFVKAVRAWKQKGFRFALDDFEFTEEWTPLLSLADVIKVDVLGQDPEQICQRKSSLAHYSCRWLAERVETLDEFNYYKENEFDLFQGYFLSRPKVIKGRNIRPEQASALEVLRVTNGESNFDAVADTVTKDVRLSIQVLKMVNSPLYNLERPVSSIKEAVVFLGMGQLRRWAVVLSLLAASENSVEANRLVLNRAKFCELYAAELSVPDPDHAFLVGLLSGLDVLLGIYPQTFIKSIMLTPEVKSALLENEGRMGKVLKLALNLEHIIATNPEKLVKTKQSVLDIYHQSFHWTETVLKSFG